jgi:hypothetical protein
MDNDTLLNIANQFLQNSEEGIKIFKSLGIDKEIVSDNEIIIEESSEDKVKLSKEERKLKRENKKKELTEKRKELKESIKPKIEKFIIQGRVYDELTTSPLKGVIIKPYLSKGKETKTDALGNFSLTLEIPILPINGVVLSNPFLICSYKGYIPFPQELLTKDRKLRGDLPLISLLNVKEAAKQELAELQNQLNEKIEDINKLILTLPERVIIERRKSIMRIINSVQNKVLPIAIGLLIVFGVKKISQLSNKTCPVPEQLNDIISQRNNIAKQLNQFYKSVIFNTALALTFTLISNSFKSGRITVQNLPLPLGFPLGVGVPYNIVSSLQGVEEELKLLEEQNKKLNKQILMALIFLVASLALIVILLRTIDKLTQECFPNHNQPLEDINPELLDLVIKEEEKDKPLISQFKGFTFSIEFEKSKIGTLNRRYAIAKNSQGVILLRGEPSFSSNPQILIDELIFYIEKNNLKAY